MRENFFRVPTGIVPAAFHSAKKTRRVLGPAKNIPADHALPFSNQVKLTLFMPKASFHGIKRRVRGTHVVAQLYRVEGHAEADQP